MLDRMRASARIGFDVDVDPDRLRPSEIARALGDPSKLQNMTGWTPRHSIDGMLSRLLDHWRARLATAG
jgi:GDP-4-dehydro-6-deoxy-D-mannose reductase